MTTLDLLGEAAEKLAAAMVSARHDADTTAAQAERIRILAEDLQRCEDLLEPVPVGTLIGSSAGAITPAALFAACPALEVRRSYEQGPSVDFMASSTRADVGRCASFVSYKFPAQVPTTSTLNAFLATLETIPTDHRAFVVVYHEPENLAPNFNVYLAMQRTVRSLIDDVNARREVPLLFGGVFTAWAAQSGQMVDFYPGVGVWDFLGWDGYSGIDAGPGRSPLEVFDDALALNLRFDLPFAIGETGVTLVAAGSSAARLQWIRDVCRLAEDAGAVACCWWNQIGKHGDDFRLTTLAEWNALNEACVA